MLISTPSPSVTAPCCRKTRTKSIKEDDVTSNQTAGGKRPESSLSMMLTSLRYPDFRLVWIGSVTEHFGEMMELVTILWLANEKSHSPLVLSLVGSGRFLPMLVFPILGGLVADRMNRCHLLMAALAGATLLYISLAILVVTDLIAIWHLVVVSILAGVATSFNHPARATIVPNLVKREHLLNAISLDTFSVMAMRVVSMPLAGYVIVSLGVWPIFVISAVSAVIPIILLRFVKTPLNPPPIKELTIRQNLGTGFQYLRSHTTVLVLLLLYILPQFVLNTVVNLLPAVAEGILNVGPVVYGYLQGATGLGALTCLIGLAMLTYYQGKRKLLLGSCIVLGAGLLGFSASQWLSLSLPLLVVIGGMSAVFTAIITALVQGFILNEMRGRIMSWREIAWGISPAGNIIFGAIAESSGAPFSLALLGGTTLLVSLSLFAFLPRLRSLEQTIGA